MAAHWRVGRRIFHRIVYAKLGIERFYADSWRVIHKKQMFSRFNEKKTGIDYFLNPNNEYFYLQI